jgi:hypothetical protein
MPGRCSKFERGGPALRTEWRSSRSGAREDEADRTGWRNDLHGMAKLKRRNLRERSLNFAALTF